MQVNEAKPTESPTAPFPPVLLALAATHNAARAALREQRSLVSLMGDENCGWGTDAQYRAACARRSALAAACDTAWAAFARAFNAHLGDDLLDPELAQ